MYPLTEEFILSRVGEVYCLVHTARGGLAVTVTTQSCTSLHMSTCSLMALGCAPGKSCRCLGTDPSSAHLTGVGQSGVEPRALLPPPSGHLQSLVLPPVQSERLSPSSSRQTACKVRREGTYRKATVSVCFSFCMVLSKGFQAK